MNRFINLYSDTQTQPTAQMRAAIAAAPVGDEQRGEDPSVNALCDRVATLLGQPAAVFMPSGTMCNELAIRVHCVPGDEVIAEASSHIIGFEGGGPAALSGVMVRPVEGDRGFYSPAQLEAAIRPLTRYAPRTALVALEQTANMAGGTVWPLDRFRAVVAAARTHGLPVHVDGARLLNACVASGHSAADFGREVDSIWIDLSKGLGCPVGAVLAGSAAFIDAVWRWKQRIGGAMRQAGILAAAGSYALDHHVERLSIDHDNARCLAEGAAGLPGVEVDPGRVETNMVFLRLPAGGAAALCAAMEEEGIRLGAMDDHTIRAVTHLDVDGNDIGVAIGALQRHLNGR